MWRRRQEQTKSRRQSPVWRYHATAPLVPFVSPARMHDRRRPVPMPARITWTVRRAPWLPVREMVAHSLDRESVCLFGLAWFTESKPRMVCRKPCLGIHQGPACFSCVRCTSQSRAILCCTGGRRALRSEASRLCCCCIGESLLSCLRHLCPARLEIGYCAVAAKWSALHRSHRPAAHI